MRYARTLQINLPYEAAVAAVKDALKQQGVGTLTEIDVRKTMNEKLGLEMENYIILGACSPQLAHRAIQIEPDLGLLLPCNVVVRQHAGGTLVQALDPGVMVSVPERPELLPVADEASRRIDAALATLAAAHPV